MGGNFANSLNLSPATAETDVGSAAGAATAREATMWQRMSVNRWSVRAFTLLAYVAVAGAGKKWR
jgi:hypothetical protein